MKYELSFVCEKDGHKVEQGYDVEFFKDEDQYGNGTYMNCVNHKPEYADQLYDIRYEQSYDESKQIQFIVDWVLGTWNGENGSYRATSISVKEIDA